ncbi:MAG: hypothetical protein KDA37_01885 [Planctomycetales bacterium]|nr:hypothetical protein [Planctomycetales bacterium]
MTVLKVTMVGDKPAVFLPADVVSRLKLVEGSEIALEEGPSGLTLVHPDPKVESQVQVMSEVMNRRRDVLKRLAE